MMWAPPVSHVDPFYDESDVRRLCGLTVFAKADAWQRDGHVLLAERSTETLSGVVRGVWRRTDSVSIQLRGKRLQPECGRHGPGFCPHVGALLLQWLRQPAAVGVVDGDGVSDDDEFGEGDLDLLSIIDPILNTPEADVEEWLMRETIAYIRDIARRRGLEVSGSRKADVAREAALGLIDPANIQQALAGLSPTERLLLDAVQLVSSGDDTSEPRAFNAYRAMGGEGEPPIDGLSDRGLVFILDVGAYRGRYVWLPDAVSAQLPQLDGLVPPLAGAPAAVLDGARGLGLVQLMTTIAHELAVGTVAALDERAVPLYGNFPPGFVVHPDDLGRVPDLMRTYDARLRVRLLVAPVMPATTVERIASVSGWSAGAVEFVARLMVARSIALQDLRLTVVSENLRRFLELDPAQQMESLTAGWLGMPGWSESGQIFSDHGPIRFVWNPRHAPSNVAAAIAEGIYVIRTLIGRMPFGQWLDAAGLSEIFQRLIPAAAPSLATLRNPTRQLDLTHNGEPLVLSTDEGWAFFVRAIIDAVLAGPLYWLGLADVAVEDDTVTGFRTRPAAAFINGGPYDFVDQGTTVSISVSDDLVISIPHGSRDTAELEPILHACRMLHATGDGLQYQLGAEGVQALLEAGSSLGEVKQLLSTVTGRPLPAAALATLDRWQSSYGQIRLYDELTLIELGDDLLLRELQVATSLEQITIHQFSPRLVAVDDRDLDTLLQELSARGYAPRIVESY